MTSTDHCCAPNQVNEIASASRACHQLKNELSYPFDLHLGWQNEKIRFTE